MGKWVYISPCTDYIKQDKQFWISIYLLFFVFAFHYHEKFSYDKQFPYYDVYKILNING